MNLRCRLLFAASLLTLFWISNSGKGEERQPWLGSRLQGSPEEGKPYRLERVFPKLSFKQPVIMTSSPENDLLYVVELEGKIFAFDPSKAGSKSLVLDLKESVSDFFRVYGLTFHPKVRENRECFVCYVIGNDKEDGTRVSRFKLIDSNPPKIDPKSEEILVEWYSGGHNGGCLKFGPKDGYLYISAGDGGPAFPPDPKKTGQDISDLLAGVLRIDVDHPDPGLKYGIPKDNPFVNTPGARKEVWAYGMRNPWKISFDRDTGDLWVGDVGWELWEMIYRVQPGGNYGWSIVEGRQPVHEERPRGPTPILEPTVAHSHIESRSITGGHTYHGTRLEGLRGHYIYGDYVTGKVWSCIDQKGKMAVKEIAEGRVQIICFGRDRAGEVYVVDYQGGIYQLVPNPRVAANAAFPKRLSETGLFADIARHQLASGVLPYQIKAEPWADGTEAVRFLALPEKSKLDIHQKQNVWLGEIKGDWKYPDGAVLGKTIMVDTGNGGARRRLETQILLMDKDVWRPFSYHWNEEQTDAVLAGPEGRDLEIPIKGADIGREKLHWHFASRTECLLCHTTRGGSVYGFQPAQLDRLVKVGKRTTNQLERMSALGYFKKPVPKIQHPMVDPYDDSAPLAQRARSYLHVNCAHCHRRGGGGTAAMDVRMELSLKKTNLLEARPTQGAFGIHAAEVFPEGDPYRSVIYYRMAKLGKGRMPHIGSSQVDASGLRLIHDWITSFSEPARPSVTSLRNRQNEDLETLRGSDDKQQATVVKSLLSSTSGALQLVKELNEGRLAEPVKQLVIQEGTSGSPAIRDLFESFVPADKRVKRLGTSINVAELLQLQGNAERGRVFFATAADSQCRNCHKIGTVGKEIGPELSHIAKDSNKRQLLESILRPSQKIDPKFVTYLVETDQGRVHSGVLVKRDTERIILRGADGKDIQLKTSEVELITPQQKSLMPDLLLRDLTAQQVADLLAYLSTLK